ncbi:60S ribosomal protein L32 [Tupaia chinensis]|uniref:60S ribosomal protein L32 n=1 Tax=Tupaia chinensis TaxID=246437 RepID=L9KWT1_TUPCH|nr:60S ribosomal protein L32 [Tupaia chinensis]
MPPPPSPGWLSVCRTGPTLSSVQNADPGPAAPALGSTPTASPPRHQLKAKLHRGPRPLHGSAATLPSRRGPSSHCRPQGTAPHSNKNPASTRCSGPRYLRRWWPSPTRHHGCPQAPCETKVVKTKTEKFIQHQSDRYVKIKHSWWKPRGTDNRVWMEETQGPDLDAQHRLRQQQENEAHAAQRLPAVPGPHAKELEVLLMCGGSYCAEVGHVSSKSHKAIVERAAPLAIGVTTPDARLRSEENEETACVHILFVSK